MEGVWEGGNIGSEKGRQWRECEREEMEGVCEGGNRGSEEGRQLRE